MNKPASKEKNSWNIDHPIENSFDFLIKSECTLKLRHVGTFVLCLQWRQSWVCKRPPCTGRLSAGLEAWAVLWCGWPVSYRFWKHCTSLLLHQCWPGSSFAMAGRCHQAAFQWRQFISLFFFLSWSSADLSDSVLSRQPSWWQLMQTSLSSTSGRDRMCTSCGILSDRSQCSHVLSAIIILWWEMVSCSGVWRVIVFRWMSWAPLWWCTAPGPAGPSSHLVHGLVVGESLIAHGNAPILGEWSWLVMFLNNKPTPGRVLDPRPAFGGTDCEGADVEAELCHQQVSSSCWCLLWQQTRE